VATQVSTLPPVGSLFAAFLGFNPVARLLGPSGTLDTLPRASADTLTGKEFFPHLISGPFHQGLVVVFGAAAAMMVLGALFSLMRGAAYVHQDDDAVAPPRRLVAAEEGPQ
jgi:hypothetical protein